MERPHIVDAYNTFMLGVDKADMLLSLFRTRYRSRKLYHRIAFHLFSLAAVNPWLLYQRIGGDDTLVKFLGKYMFLIDQRQ